MIFYKNYIGATSKTKEQLIGDNTDSAKILFDLQDYQHALVADGTYLFCGKS